MFLVCLSISGAAKDHEIATAKLDAQEIKLFQSEDSGDQSLTLRIADQAPLALATHAKAEGKGLRADPPFQAKPFALPGGVSGSWVSFGLDDGNGSARAVTVLLVRVSDKENWSLAREWVAESGALGELGFKRESQEFDNKDERTLIRHFKSLAVEGLAHRMDCGCIACQSRATEITEDETLEWNAQTHSFDRLLRQKWYTAQPGENLFTVARKALGDARMMQLIIKLSPELKDAPPFKGGEKILIEREEKKK
jgi:hypothetical protein